MRHAKGKIFSALSAALLLTAGTIFGQEVEDRNAVCTRGADALSFTIGGHMGSGPAMCGLLLNDITKPYAGYLAFYEMLKASKLDCEDLRSYADVKAGEVLLCHGEMLTQGGLELIKDKIAPKAGWTCE